MRDDMSELKKRAMAIVDIYSDLNKITEREVDILREAITEGRPQGKWVFKDLHNGKTWYECSICGRKIHIGDKAQLSYFPFCHCGADMRGDTKEDNSCPCIECTSTDFKGDCQYCKAWAKWSLE